MDYTKASDLVKWAKVQLESPNYYQNGGIGRYDGNKRIFDCCGLFKCFMWHDYPNNDGPACYNKTQKDYNCEQLIAEATEKGDISTIPEIPGVLVYQYGHMGIYIGNGEVIESTAAKFDGVNGKIYKTYFKGNNSGYKRTTWTHWFKSPNLTYDTPVTPTPTPAPQPANDNYLGNRGYFMLGDEHPNIGKIADFMYRTFPLYTDKRALGNYYGPYIKASITEFQRRAKEEGTYNDVVDGCVGPITLASLEKYGFRR